MKHRTKETRAKLKADKVLADPGPHTPLTALTLGARDLLYGYMPVASLVKVAVSIF